jgi:PKD repeat protein
MVAVERITNGYVTNFSGDAPLNWTTTGTARKDGDYSHYYSVYLYGLNAGSISQTVNFVGVSALTLRHGGGGWNYRFKVYINGTQIADQTGFNSGTWNALSIDIPSNLRVANATLLIQAVGTGWYSPLINTISAIANVVANFTVEPTTALAHVDTVVFTDTSEGASSWLWDFGDGDTSTLQNPTHVYTDGGNLTVTLKINGGTSGDYVKTAPITVLDPRCWVMQCKHIVTGSGDLLVCEQQSNISGTGNLLVKETNVNVVED